MTTSQIQDEVKVLCPKCKKKVEIDSSKGVKLVKVEKEKKLEKGGTPLDIALAIFENTEVSEVKRLLKELGLSSALLKAFEEEKADIIDINREIISHKLLIPLKCRHTVSVEPYKVFESLLNGYYADAVIKYLSSKRPSPKDEEKAKIAEFVRVLMFISSVAVYHGVLEMLQSKGGTEDLIEAFCEKLELDDNACNEVKRIVEESKAKRETDISRRDEKKV